MQIILEQEDAPATRFEVEIDKGKFVFMENRNDGDSINSMFCPWDKLDDKTKEEFDAVRKELSCVAYKAQALFKNVPLPEPGEDW